MSIASMSLRSFILANFGFIRCKTRLNSQNAYYCFIYLDTDNANGYIFAL